ncbi:molybdopterin molybdenumtransferase [bacterium BMS3Abin01]|nr:molybdopterin molybdenumtransferase [bacterium BMS3Abin01]HDY69667.1 molybdopterin molybdenumtransferase MoeA [Actinomycetota bacterium]
MDDSAELFSVTSPRKALQELLQLLSPPTLPEETVPLAASLGRYLARDIIAPEQVPPFTRSTMDGYAIRSRDTFGASGSNPVYLELVGKVSMGEAARIEVGAGQAAAIATGGMMPPGADAVLMIEYTDLVDETTLEAIRPVGPGENIIGAGKDIERGETLLAAGARLRPQELGAMAALGITKVSVRRPVKVGILSTGDEIVDIDERPGPGRIRDINQYSLAAATRETGAEARSLGICPDEAAQLETSILRGIEECELVLVSGGSSVGVADLTPRVINSLGEPGVLVHGLAVKPGKPTILALVRDTPVFGLPGHAISTLDIFRLVVAPVIRFLFSGKEDATGPEPTVRARIGRNIASVAGRVDRHRVVLRHDNGQLWAEPLLGKSGLISLMVKAEGVAVIPLEAEGVSRGDELEVELI